MTDQGLMYRHTAIVININNNNNIAIFKNEFPYVNA